MEKSQTPISETTRTPPASHELGFGLVLLLALLPLALFLMWGVMMAISLMQIKSLPLQTCRFANLQIQKQNEIAIEDLFTENKNIRQLRIQKKVAQIQLASALASGNIAASTLAKKNLGQILDAQARAYSHQMKILNYHNFFLESEKIKVRSDILTKFKKLSQKLILLGSAQMLELQVFLPPLAIQVLSGSNTPDDPAIFGRQKDFSLQQVSHVSWKTIIHAASKGLVEKLLPTASFWQGKCAASLFKEGSQWQPHILQEDKY